ncbi:MAG: metal ABC transporter permease [Candidatus Nanopelagicales bacterium]
MLSLFDFDFMRRALVAAALVGLVAPLVGVFLVQRRLALLGDGMGHVALTGVGLAFLLGTAPVVTAMITAVIGAAMVELIRERSRTAGDLALALLFYGGIAGGVLFASLAPGKASASLNSYLFGSLATVSTGDLTALGALVMILLLALAIWGRQLLAVSVDPQTAFVQGVPVRALSLMMAVMSAVTVVVGMRVVGLLLVSAIMIVPIAAAQQITRSFRGTAALGSLLGAGSAVLGLAISFVVQVPPGPTIVILALCCFVALLVGAPVVRRARLRVSVSSEAGPVSPS